MRNISVTKNFTTSYTIKTTKLSRIFRNLRQFSRENIHVTKATFLRKAAFKNINRNCNWLFFRHGSYIFFALVFWLFFLGNIDGWGVLRVTHSPIKIKQSTTS